MHCKKSFHLREDKSRLVRYLGRDMHICKQFVLIFRICFKAGMGRGEGFALLILSHIS